MTGSHPRVVSIDDVKVSGRNKQGFHKIFPYGFVCPQYTDLPKCYNENRLFSLTYGGRNVEKITYERARHDDDDSYYRERTDRNIGWITPEEQDIVRHSVVGVAGNGGMGGLLSVVLLRTGFGEIRIADKENFDYSNMNRQYAARRETIGKSKALETANELRRITDDAKIVVYPEGVTEETVDDFVTGCDLIFDEIEFFAASARILLHERARKSGVPLFNCNVVGFGTRLFLFTPESMTMEGLLGFSYKEALEMEHAAKNGDTVARERLIAALLEGLVPELPEYKMGDRETALRRLVEEGKAPIFGTNPPLSTGFVADRAVLYLLKKAGIAERNIVDTPPVPAYLLFDAAFMRAHVGTIRRKGWCSA